MSGRLPALLDCKAVMHELGVTRAAAEKIMRQLDVIELTDAGLRKSYVKRADVHALLDVRGVEQEEADRHHGSDDLVSAAVWFSLFSFASFLLWKGLEALT